MDRGCITQGCCWVAYDVMTADVNAIIIAIMCFLLSFPSSPAVVALSPLFYQQLDFALPILVAAAMGWQFIRPSCHKALFDVANRCLS